MKVSSSGLLTLFTALAGQAAAGSSCNSNNCLRAVIGSAVPTRHGAADCSSYLAVTITPSTSTITSTQTIRPTVYTTSVESDLFTTSRTTTVMTETQTASTQQTLTASTETDFVTVTVTDPAKLQGRIVSFIPVTPSSSTYPAYASPCSAWDKYVSACSCVGVFPTTVILATPLSTTVVTETHTVTSSILFTTSTTETDTVLATATTATTGTLTVSVTASTLATVTSTVAPANPSPVCNPAPVGSFLAHATQYFDQDLYMYPDYDSLDVSWREFSYTSGEDVNLFSWTIDSNGDIQSKTTVGGSEVIIYLYTVTTPGAPATGSLSLGSAEKRYFDGGVAAGAPFVRVKACVDPETQELYLSVAGRTQILYCENGSYMSNTLGADLAGRRCFQMFPTIIPQPTGA